MSLDFKKLSSVNGVSTSKTSSKVGDSKKRRIKDNGDWYSDVDVYAADEDGAEVLAVERYGDRVSEVYESTEWTPKDGKKLYHIELADSVKKTRRAELKKRVKDELEETETTDEAIDVVDNIMAEAEDPQEVAAAAVEVLSDVIDVLTEKNEDMQAALQDSRKRSLKKPAGAKKVMDKNEFKAFKKRVKDELEETETTDEAVTTVKQFLEEAAPEDVITATVEVLGETIDNLQAAASNVEDSKK